MIRHIRLLCCALLTLAASLALTGTAKAQDAFGPRITATRWVLPHGRADDVRPAGISTAANPRGQNVPGAANLINLIATQPNPRQITLGLNAAGDLPANSNSPSPLIAAGAGLSSGMTLVVAEVPVGGSFGGWKSLTSRFGAGNLYATVSIPEGGISAGQELVTAQQLAAYTANSVLFEAPAFGNVVVRHGLSGGTSNVSATIGTGRREEVYTRNFGWAQPLEMVMASQKVQHRRESDWTIRVRAQLPNSLESTVTIRWAAQWSGGTHMGQETVTLTKTSGTLAQFAEFTVTVPKEAKQDEMVTISAVATPGSFLTAMMAAPHAQSIGQTIFHSDGPTLEDTLSVQLKTKGAMDVTVNGTLSPGATNGPRAGRYFKVHNFDVEEGTTYTIELASGTGATKDSKALPGFFDSFLIVEGGSSKVNIIAANDDIDWPNNCNSRVTFTATTSGTITVYVTSYREQETGPYTLHIQSE